MYRINRTKNTIINNLILLKMDRKLISKDESGIQRTVKQLTDFAKELNPLIEAYNVLNIGKYNNEVYQSQLTYRGENEIKIYLNLEREQLLKAGITNEVSIQGILKTHETTIQEYKDKINNVLEKRSEANFLDISVLEYSNNKFILSKSSVDAITEKYSTYANGKEEIEIVEQTEQLIKDFYLLKSKIEKYVGHELRNNLRIKDYVFNNLVIQYTTEDKMQFKTDSLSSLRRLKRELNN